MSYATKKEAEEEADRKTRESYARLNTSIAFNNAQKYFRIDMGPDEELMNIFHLVVPTDRNSDLKDNRDSVLKDHTFNKLVTDGFGYGVVTAKAEYTKYSVNTITKSDTMVSGYSGTVSSGGDISLSPDVSSYDYKEYEISPESKKEKIMDAVKVTKKEDRKEIEALEKKVWEQKDEYSVVKYCGRTAFRRKDLQRFPVS